MAIDKRDPEQIGLAIKELRKVGLSACEAADRIDKVTTPVKTEYKNGNGRK